MKKKGSITSSPRNTTPKKSTTPSRTTPPKAVAASPKQNLQKSNSGSKLTTSPKPSLSKTPPQQQTPPQSQLQSQPIKPVQRLQQQQQRLSNQYILPRPLQAAADQLDADNFKAIQFTGQSNFSDDQELVKINDQVVGKKVDYDCQKFLHLDVRSKCKNVKLGTEMVQLPLMITIRTEDEEVENQTLQQINEEVKEQAKEPAKGPSRSTGIDLICVIDISGSMSGQKIALVRSTLTYVLEQLTEIDRLCLIQFDDTCHRRCPLIPMTEENKVQVSKVIKSLAARGGTDIALGMACAFSQIVQRKHINQVTSVFLLSDGLDNGAELKVQQQIIKYKLELTSFTIHSFGFGEGHDPKLMSEIAGYKDGNFYFIQDLNKIDECFINALGALFSVVAQDIVLTITLNVQPNALLKAKCTQTYGPFWTLIKESTYEIKITQLISGVSKDFIMEVELPSFAQANIDDQRRNLEIVSVQLRGVSSGDMKPFTHQKNLVVTLYGTGEDAGEIDEDGEVMENYCRVKAAQAMAEALELGNKGQYAEGQKAVEKAIIILEGCKKNKKVNQEKIESLQKDLVSTKQQCDPKIFNQYGKHQMIMMNKCHMEQKSNGIEEEEDCRPSYSNKKQKSMKVSLLSKKQR